MSQVSSRQSFCHWHKRRAEQHPMKFAPLETSHRAPAVAAAAEVMPVSGERLRIVTGVDATTLSLVLSVLREPQ
jgi:hypothetical protein